MGSGMNDMLGTTITVGDVVLYPGGSARYGGLKLIVGVVVKMTAKRMTLLGGPLVRDAKEFKTTSKTGAKVLLVSHNNIMISETVKAIKAQISSDANE